jgi:hypothetical protein
VVQLLAIEGEARGAVRHDTLTLSRPDRGAQIGLAGQAGGALPAFGRIERDNMVALFDAGHARSDIDDDAGTLMTQNGGEQALRVGPGERELIGVANAGRLDLDQNLPGLGTIQLDISHLKRFGFFQCNSSAGFHAVFLLGEKLVSSKTRRGGPARLSLHRATGADLKIRPVKNMTCREQCRNCSSVSFGRTKNGADLNSSSGG